MLFITLSRNNTTCLLRLCMFTQLGYRKSIKPCGKDANRIRNGRIFSKCIDANIRGYSILHMLYIRQIYRFSLLTIPDQVIQKNTIYYSIFIVGYFLPRQKPRPWKNGCWRWEEEIQNWFSFMWVYSTLCFLIFWWYGNRVSGMYDIQI